MDMRWERLERLVVAVESMDIDQEKSPFAVRVRS